MCSLKIFQLAFLLPILISCGNSTDQKDILSGISGSEIVLKSGGAYNKLKMSDIQSVVVTVKSLPPSTEQPLTRTFTGDKVSQVLSVMGLHKPSEPGFPSAIETGEVILNFSSRNLQIRTIKILNHDILEDWSSKEVIYRASEKLDRTWLEKQ